MIETTEQISMEELVGVLENRREFYLVLAGLYIKPLTQEQIDAMAETDYSPFGVGEPLLEDGFNDITRFLRKRNTGTRQTLATEYTTSFGAAATYGGKTAVPYASVHLSEKGLMGQEQTAEVYRIFARNLLKSSNTSIPDDHLSLMLEFLAVMSDRAATALRDGRIRDAQSCLDESLEFINKQILTWFDKFSDIANRLIEHRFYRGVLKITKGYLLLDLQIIDDLLKVMSKA